MKLMLTRTIHGFAPADNITVELIKKYRHGEVYRADVVKPRDGKNLRRWWALCNLVYEQSDQFPAPKVVHKYLKIRAGHCTPIVNQSTGEVFLIDDSISYARIDEAEFQDVWRRAVDVVCQEILPGTASTDIENEILKCCGLAA